MLTCYGENVKFTLPAGQEEDLLIDKLADQYPIQRQPAVYQRITVYDTFDWRLFNKSLALYSSGKQLFLRKLAKNDTICSIEPQRPPVFAWDLPEGELKNRLAPTIKMRALLKLVELRTRSTPYRILNRDQKTVARLFYEVIQLANAKDSPVLAARIWLKPVRGYPKYSRKLASHFSQEGFTLSKDEEVFIDALKAAGKDPGRYSAKVVVKLDPDMRSEEATKNIMRFLLQVIRINEAEIEKDLDTEFLHDFRVAIRRTRSALAQVKQVFPAEDTERFKKGLAYVGKLSNELRDLDVYLLNQKRYKAKLPPVLREDIDPLFAYLRQKRAATFKEVITGLKSERYAEILAEWEAFLDQEQTDSPRAPNADLPIIDLARKRIRKKYRQIVKEGSLILEHTEDELLHALRIQCKKLRYLMELFTSLFARGKIAVLIQQLKKLQDNLGDFNDLCVQEEYLLKICGELPADHPQLRKTLVAMGSLIGALGEERKSVKNAFAKTFKKFASPANKELFRKLFS